MALATISDITNRWLGGSLAPDHDDQVLLTLLEDCEDLVLDKVPNIADLLEAETVRASTVKRTMAKAIQRAYELGNTPQINYSESIGQFSQGASFNPNQKRGLYLTAGEVAELSGTNRSSNGRYFAIDLMAGYEEELDTYEGWD